MDTYKKKITIDDIRSTVNEFVDFIKPTYGPLNNSIILSDPYRNDNLDDGVLISEEYEFDDPIKNAIFKKVIEVARRTNDRVGDGTTGSMIMLQALLNTDEFKGDLNKAVIDAKEQLIGMSREVQSKEELKNVSKVSYNNEEMSEIISNMVYEMGPNGVIVIEESNNLSTKNQIVDGLRFERGYVSPFMMTDPERKEAVLNNPFVLIIDKKLSSINDILPIVEKIINSGKKDILLIADEIENQALSLLIVNKLKGVFNMVAVRTPGFGDNKNEILKDISVLTNSTIVSDYNNINLNEIDISMLGSARKIIVTKDNTTIVEGKGDVEERVKELNKRIKETDDENEIKGLTERIAKLTKGIGLIQIGASTESEMKKIKYKVEDSVNATRLAFRSGVVPGAGIALNNIKTCSDMLNKALKQPGKVLMENIGEFEPDEKIIDPVEVLIASIETSVSMANMLMLTKGVIAKVPKQHAHE